MNQKSSEFSVISTSSWKLRLLCYAALILLAGMFVYYQFSIQFVVNDFQEDFAHTLRGSERGSEKSKEIALETVLNFFRAKTNQVSRDMKAKLYSSSLVAFVLVILVVAVVFEPMIQVIQRQIRDLNEQKSELDEARIAAEDANRVKSQFLANISHEIRTPINGVLGMTELALYTKLTDQQREYIETVRDSADSLLFLLNDLLDISKIEAQRLELDQIDFDLHRCIKRSMRMLAGRAKKKGLQFAGEITRQVPRILVGDPNRLRQVLLNLISNAVKFTSEGHVLVRARLLEETETTATVKFTIEDTGIGIPADKHATIFEAFRQSDSSTTRNFGGSGLGLAISSQLTELMGGEISVESEPGKGSKFRFTAKFDKSDKTSLDEKKSPATVPASSEPRRVLVVEDNETNQAVVVGLLEARGHQTVVAGNGVEAITAMRKHIFDVVLMDVQMPVMDGVRAVRFIRRQEAKGEHVPVVGLSANALEGERQRCLHAGMDHYLSKPIDSKELLTLVATTPVSSVGRPQGEAWSELTHHDLPDTQPAVTFTDADQMNSDSDPPSHGIDPDPTPIDPMADSVHDQIVPEELWDAEAMLKTFDNDIDLLCELISVYCKDAPNLLARIQVGLERHDPGEIRLAAHSLKGASATIQATKVVEYAEKIELLAKSNELGEIPALYARLQLRLRTTLGLMQQRLRLENHPDTSSTTG